jgi:hypothetical protein
MNIEKNMACYKPKTSSVSDWYRVIVLSREMRDYGFVVNGNTAEQQNGSTKNVTEDKLEA